MQGERASDWKRAFSKSNRIGKASHGRFHCRLTDDAAPITDRIVEATPRGVEQELVAWLKPLSRVYSCFRKGHALTCENPRQRLAISDHEQVRGHRDALLRSSRQVFDSNQIT